MIAWLADAQPEVAAQCLLESGAVPTDGAGALALPAAQRQALQAAWGPRLTDLAREPAPEARAALGRALGRLGLDERPGVGLDADGLPAIDWVPIPGGAFVYQAGEQRTVAAFRIARYPITHAQFQAFLEALDGYADDRWWVGMDDPARVPAATR